MHKMRNLLGLPVLSLGTGKQIGKVQDVILDIEHFSICGITVDMLVWTEVAVGIYYKDILSIGGDAIMIRNSECFIPIDALLADKTSLKQICDKEVFTESGYHIGFIGDVLFTNKTGEIRAYQISEGLITDLLYGRKIMPIPKVQLFCNERLIVQETACELLQKESDVFT